MAPAADSPQQLFAQYKRAMAYIAPYWPRLLPVVAVSLFATALGLTQPYISKLLIDNALLPPRSYIKMLMSASHRTIRYSIRA